jgi:hypothetical protein
LTELPEWDTFIDIFCPDLKLVKIINTENNDKIDGICNVCENEEN